MEVEIYTSTFETVFRWYPDMRGATKEWCDLNLKRHPTFRKVGGLPERYFAEFDNPSDAMLFKLHWS